MERVDMVHHVGVLGLAEVRGGHVWSQRHRVHQRHDKQAESIAPPGEETPPLECAITAGMRLKIACTAKMMYRYSIRRLKIKLSR